MNAVLSLVIKAQNSEPDPEPQILSLAPRAQAVINGALVTAMGPCILEVGSGAFVLTGPALWREQSALRNPREELYFSMLDAGTNPDRFSEARFRLFHLLGQVVAQERTHKAQRECALCAAALIAGNVEEAIRSAARIATDGLEKPAARGRVPPPLRAARRDLGLRAEDADA